jgi:hypothetical protein
LSDTRDEGTSSSEGAWEKPLREQEIRNQRRGTRFQLVTAIAASATALAAVWLSINASKAISVAKQSVERQAEENRIGTAVDAIKSDGPVAQRIAALTLLRRQAIQKLERANEGDPNDTDRRDALDFFRSTLKVLDGYIREPVRSSPDQAALADPSLPLDVHSAARDMQQMLTRKSLFNDVRSGGDLSILDRELPDIDLSDASLYRVLLNGLDMSWLSAGDFSGIDLRFARLEGSRWRRSDLTSANLRCAMFPTAHFDAGVKKSGEKDPTDLSNADVRNADLTGADLRGATLASANLQGAKLDGAKVAGTDFSGANLDSGALDNAVGREKAVGLNKPPDPPPTSETEVKPECLAP